MISKIYNSDGTRIKDGFFAQLSDRISGRAAVTRRNLSNAEWGKGPLAGKTGDIFKDDPFFNKWAPGGAFTKASRSNPMLSNPERSPSFDPTPEEVEQQAKYHYL